VNRSHQTTIRDVATLADVHPGTASRALNLPDKVAPATRARVERAAQELGYVPNRAARSLITGTTGNIAVIVPDITNPHFASILRAVEQSARDSALQVLLLDTDQQPELELQAVKTLARDVDGFILISPEKLQWQSEALRGKNAVFINRPVAGHGSVLFETATAVNQAIRHLSTLGHSTLAYLGPSSHSWAANERRRSVMRSAEAHGLKVIGLTADEPTFDGAFAAVAESWSGGLATSVLAFNDVMAMGVIASLSVQELHVPDDVSVIGIDDIPGAAMATPALTTIALPAQEAGRAALSKLHEHDTTTTQLKSILVTRSSSGPVSQRHANDS
jgi:LacI family transcriptional regulator